MSENITLANLAPWGASLPRPDAVMTATDLLHMVEDSHGYELIEGRLVQMPPTDFDHGDMTAELTMVLRAFVKKHRLGTILTGEPGFLISHNPDTVLAPDVAFVSARNSPPKGSPQRSGFFTTIPDLVVEVASPSQHKREMETKARRWLTAGVQLIWIVWQKRQQIDVWQAGPKPAAQTLKVGDDLDGLDVLPGFRHSVGDLFA